VKDSDKPSSADSHLDNPANETPTVVNTGTVTRERFARQRRATFWKNTRWTMLAVASLFTMAFGTILGNFCLRSPALARMFFHINPMVAFSHPGDPLLASFDPKKEFPNAHTINVLILGCDVDYSDTRPVELKNSRGRSDSIMIAHVDFDNQTINILSIPRDTAVNIPEHGFHKINAAHAYGGADLSQRTIRDTFGIVPDYYVGLNYDTFEKVIDQVGGVDITVHKKLDYDDNWGNLHIHLKPGFQHLNGRDAMGYVRYRHSDGDLARAERQHEFLEALKQKVGLATFSKLPELVNTVSDSLETNMKTEQILALVHFSRNLPKERMQSETLPALEAKNFVYLDPIKSESVIRRLFFNNENLVAINVNLPERSTINRSGSKKRHTSHSDDENVPRDDDGKPLIDNDNNAPKPSKDAPPDSTSDGSGKPDAGEKSDPSKKPDAKPDENKGDGDKSGGKSGDGKDNGAKPAASGEMVG